MTCRFEERLKQSWPVSSWQTLPVIVAVSGGADSIALLRGLISLAEQSTSTLVVAHFDHRLRPDSEQDADFVDHLCRELQVRFEIGRATQDLAVGSTGSIEQVARDARYEFLTQVAHRVGARYVATAHTANDQAETILHRIVRGTGIRGLSGIPVSRELVPGITLVRPLLDIHREEVVEYLGELGQTFRNDATNLDESFTRNRIRNSLLPLIRKDYNMLVDESLRRLGALAGEMSDFVELAATEQISRCVTLSATEASIDLTQTPDMPPLILRTMLRQIWRVQNWPQRDMSFERWHELESLVSARDSATMPRAFTLPSNLLVSYMGSKLTIQKQSQP
ncbi:MAG: tRNA lysidine(34) synthetase TilS [Planctomycetaceae bacterium]|nr:tRNA lysidine(34) synthetase TilS [Planctomycetales bacterium]MCB9874246.1 tRNA lysidine(34) synthetase TilS [Planctomycetaceae bacterium]